MDILNTFLEYLKDPQTPFGVFDPVYGIVLIFGFIRGVFRGLPEELSQLLGTILMFAASMKFYTPVSAFIMEHTRLDDPTASMALSYLLILLLFMIVWKLITFLLRKVLDWSCPKQLKRMGGAVVGVCKNALLIAVVLAAVLISGHRVLRESMIEKSWFGRKVQNLLPAGIVSEDDGTPPVKETDANGSGNA